MRRNIMQKGAVISAFFIAWLSAPAGWAADDCAAPPEMESVQVRHVHDGDTLWLSDGRKLRLIGIDTPELGHKQRPAQPYAEQARQALRKLVADSNHQIKLSYGPQRYDRYRRTLAHLYSADGRSLQAELLRQGLATAFTTPPNNTRSPCYRRMEAIAMDTGIGIWSLPRYRLIPAAQLNAEDNGFRRISGQVERIRFTRKGTYLELGSLLVKIKPADLRYFDHNRLQQLNGKTVQIRGWVHPRKDRLFMLLRHPDALIIDSK